MPCRLPSVDDLAPWRDAAAGQRGSILVSAAVFILIGLALLGTVQLGYMYYTQRQLQNAADLAALSGVQSLDPSASAGDGGCAAAKSVALAVAQANFPGMAVSDPAVDCGVWTPGAAGAQYSSADPAQPGNINAVQIQLSHSVAPVTPFSQDHNVNAVARAATSPPIAAFSVGSRLLSVNSTGLIGSILSTAGLGVNALNVLDSSGVATFTMQPSGLLQALGLPVSVAGGVGTPEQLAQLSNLTLGDFLHAMATAVAQSGTEADIDLVGNAITALLTLSNSNPLKLDLGDHVQLFGEEGVFGTLDGEDAASAMSAQVNAMDLIGSAIIVANGRNAINLNLISLGVASASLQVVQPPTLAIGGIGTTAESAQLRLNLSLGLGDIPLLTVPILGTLTAPLGISLLITIANSEGTLQSLCVADLARDHAVIATRASIAELCLTKNSSSGVCATHDDPAVLAGIKNVVTVSSFADASIGESDPVSQEFAVGAPSASVGAGKIDSLVGDAVSQIVSHVSVTLLGSFSLDLGVLRGTLQAALSPLDNIVTQVLNLLGLNLGTTDVRLYSVQCAVPHVVY